MIKQRCNKVIVGNLVITWIVFAVMLVLNFHTDYTADDFKYRFFFDAIGCIVLTKVGPSAMPKACVHYASHVSKQ